MELYCSGCRIGIQFYNSKELDAADSHIYYKTTVSCKFHKEMLSKNHLIIAKCKSL